jgi:hypothetical protein
MLYSPWLPVLLKQAQRVRERFWIGTLTPRGLGQSFAKWCTGIDGAGLTTVVLCLVVAAMVALWMLACRDRAGIFFLLQAAVPWALTIAISLGGRPLLQERFLAPAQLSLAALFGVALARMPATWPRVLAALIVLPTCLVPTIQFLETLPEGAPNIQTALEAVQADYRPGDVVVAGSPSGVNIIRYYAHRLGFSPIDVRCPVDQFRPPGHENHISSLTPADILWDGDQPPIGINRIWIVRRGTGLASQECPAGWKVVSTSVFAGEGNDRDGTLAYSVVLQARIE